MDFGRFCVFLYFWCKGLFYHYFFKCLSGKIFLLAECGYNVVLKSMRTAVGKNLEMNNNSTLNCV